MGLINVIKPVHFSKQQRRRLTSATSRIRKNSWEYQDLNLGPRGVKRERYPLCYAGPLVFKNLNLISCYICYIGLGSTFLTGIFISPTCNFTPIVSMDGFWKTVQRNGSETGRNGSERLKICAGSFSVKAVPSPFLFHGHRPVSDRSMTGPLVA